MKDMITGFKWAAIVFICVMAIWGVGHQCPKTTYTIDTYTPYGIYRLDIQEDSSFISEESSNYKLSFASEAKAVDYMEWITARDVIIRDSLATGLFLDDPLSKSDTLLVSKTIRWEELPNGDRTPIRKIMGYLIYRYDENTYIYKKAQTSSN